MTALIGKDDLDRIMAVMEAAFDPLYGEAWTRRQVSDALLTSHCHYALLGCDSAPPRDNADAAGFTMSRHLFEDEELLLIAVHPAARRQGIGSALIENLCRSARERGATRLFLEMREGNPAEELYRCCGFLPVGRRKDYYRDGQGGRIDAITFAKII